MLIAEWNRKRFISLKYFFLPSKSCPRCWNEEFCDDVYLLIFSALFVYLFTFWSSLLRTIDKKQNKANPRCFCNENMQNSMAKLAQLKFLALFSGFSVLLSNYYTGQNVTLKEFQARHVTLTQCQIIHGWIEKPVKSIDSSRFLQPSNYSRAFWRKLFGKKNFFAAFTKKLTPLRARCRLPIDPVGKSNTYLQMHCRSWA